MEKETFIMKKEHLKLLRKMYVAWWECEFGAPSINCKRPYGNSDVITDMLDILGLKELKPGIFEFTLNGKTWFIKGEDKWNLYLDGKDEESLVEALNRLHEETEATLQVVLSTGTFKEGKYEKDDYGIGWNLVKS